MEYYLAKRAFHPITKFGSNLRNSTLSHNSNFIPLKRMYATVELRPILSTSDKLRMKKFNILRYDRFNKDYVVQEMTLDKIFPKNKSVCFLSNFPCLSYSQKNKLLKQRLDKSKFFKEGLVSKTPSSALKGSNANPLYISKFQKLKENYDFDSIVSVSNLSVDELKKFARKNEVEDFHWFLLPRGTSFMNTKLTALPNQRMKLTSLSIFNTLDLAECMVNKLELNEKILSNNFEALIKNSKIYDFNIKAVSYNYYKILMIVLIPLGMIGLASAIRVHYIAFGMSNKYSTN
ncbi:unnamed protein product [Moneuplotes crassus]|uniref:Uncharacterized protein n=1 Tax=Euplotes crassus TaxID=5936 RepID=A0AAD2CXW9_EUPCR|nr:unnamed protein product [Moneuplotes crassus]